MKSKSFISLAVAAIVLGGIISGVFVGGMAVGEDRGKEAATQDLRSQFSEFAQSTEMENMPTDGLGLMGRGGTVGTVTGIEEGIVTMETRDGSSLTVIVGDSTSVQVTTEGSIENLSPGDSIVASGDLNEDGSMEANSIQLMSSGIAGQTPGQMPQQ
jgi:hypothetical protein